MILSHKQLEEIAAAVTKDFNSFFFGTSSGQKKTNQATPIDQLASEYLGLSVSFVRLSPDASICGVTAYADTEYTVEEMGVTRRIPLKKNQVLLDSSFMQPGQFRGRAANGELRLPMSAPIRFYFKWNPTRKRVPAKRSMPHGQRIHSVT